MQPESKQIRYTCKHVETDSYCRVEHREFHTPYLCKMRHYRQLDQWVIIEIQRGFFKRDKVRIVESPFAGLVIEVTSFKTCSNGG